MRYWPGPAWAVRLRARRRPAAGERSAVAVPWCIGASSWTIPYFFMGFFRCLAAPAASIPQLLYVFSVKAVLAPGAVGEPVLQRQAHGAKRNILPGDLRFID